MEGTTLITYLFQFIMAFGLGFAVVYLIHTRTRRK